MDKQAEIAMMQSNIARSQLHVSRQNEIIARLVDQRHETLADQARDLLKIMQGHLMVEIDMLTRLERSAPVRSTAKMIGWHGPGV